MENEYKFTKWKIFKVCIWIISILIVLSGLGFGFDIINIQKKRVTKPMNENIERDVFENTQSYIHGKRQELAKAYGEWSGKDAEGKEIIESVIKINFADFPAEKINNEKLKIWLITIRGY